MSSTRKTYVEIKRRTGFVEPKPAPKAPKQEGSGFGAQVKNFIKTAGPSALKGKSVIKKYNRSK